MRITSRPQGLMVMRNGVRDTFLKEARVAAQTATSAPRAPTPSPSRMVSDELGAITSGAEIEGLYHRSATHVYRPTPPLESRSITGTSMLILTTLIGISARIRPESRRRRHRHGSTGGLHSRYPMAFDDHWLVNETAGRISWVIEETSAQPSESTESVSDGRRARARHGRPCAGLGRRIPVGPSSWSAMCGGARPPRCARRRCGPAAGHQ